MATLTTKTGMHLLRTGAAAFLAFKTEPGNPHTERLYCLILKPGQKNPDQFPVTYAQRLNIIKKYKARFHILG
jgi:hypothetical protein